MEIPIVVIFMAVSFSYGNAIFRSSLNSALVDHKQIGGNFAYSTFEAPAYLLSSSVIPNVIRPRQGVLQYPFYPPQQVLYPGHPIFTHPGFIPQGPIISPPFISAPQPPPSGSPSQVIVDEDTVAIDSA